MDIKKHQNSSYQLLYHIVLVTKNREKLIDEEIGEFLKKEFIRLWEGKGEIKKMAYQEDHFFLLGEINPTIPLSSHINTIKSVTSRKVRQKFPISDSFWDSNYFIKTVGDFSRDIAEIYIDSRGK